MAFLIGNHVYRVAVGSERTFVYVAAKDTKELTDFLIAQYGGKEMVYSVKEYGPDGFMYHVSDVPSINLKTYPSYTSLDNKIADACKDASSNPTEKKEIELVL